MKNRKERDFVKKICDELHIELISSRIEILKTDIKDGRLNSAIFEDRFKEKYLVYYDKFNQPRFRKLTFKIDKN